MEKRAMENCLNAVHRVEDDGRRSVTEEDRRNLLIGARNGLIISGVFWLVVAVIMIYL